MRALSAAAILAASLALADAARLQPSGPTWSDTVVYNKDDAAAGEVELAEAGSAESASVSPQRSLGCEDPGRQRRTKALAIAFEYSVSSGARLVGTCYDLKRVINFAKTTGFANVRYITDACHSHKLPTKKDGLGNFKPYLGTEKGKSITKDKVLKAFAWLVKDSCPGDTLFFHYSGHGFYREEKKQTQWQKHCEDEIKKKKASRDCQGKSPIPWCKERSAECKLECKDCPDDDECNANDEYIVLPGKSQFILDDELFKSLAEKVPQQVHLLAIVDACHSGTIMDLPWNWDHWKYLETAGNLASWRQNATFNKNQFIWEWKKSPEDLKREYPMQGTVTLITGSQNDQTSGDAWMEGGGVLTNALINTHQYTRFDENGEEVIENQRGILLEALDNEWTWTQTMMAVVDHVLHRNSKKQQIDVDSKKKQVPNFCTSHRFNMDAPFSLDGIMEKTEADEAGQKCYDSP